MVIVYRDKFLKAFGLMLLIALAIALLVLLIIKMGTSFITGAPLILLLSLAAFVIEGLYFYCHYLLAKAKGYTGWLVLLGFIHVFGLAIIAILPDRAKAITNPVPQNQGPPTVPSQINAKL